MEQPCHSKEHTSRRKQLEIYAWFPGKEGRLTLDMQARNANVRIQQMPFVEQESCAAFRNVAKDVFGVIGYVQIQIE